MKDLIIIFSLTFFIAILCAIVHKSKGYSPAVGFFCGILLPLISLIIFLIEKPNVIEKSKDIKYNIENDDNYLINEYENSKKEKNDEKF